MTIAVIILAWLLVNTWLSLVFSQIEGNPFEGWGEMFILFLCAVFNPFVFLGICLVIRQIVKIVKGMRKKNTDGEW